MFQTFIPSIKNASSSFSYFYIAFSCSLCSCFTNHNMYSQIGIIFIKLYSLQTKGKSLQEIQAQFRGMAAANDDVAPILDDQLESTIEAEVNAEIRTISA